MAEKETLRSVARGLKVTTLYYLKRLAEGGNTFEERYRDTARSSRVRMATGDAVAQVPGQKARGEGEKGKGKPSCLLE